MCTAGPRVIPPRHRRQRPLGWRACRTHWRGAARVLRRCCGKSLDTGGCCMARQANLAVGSVGAMLLSLASLATPLNVSAAPTETPVYFSACGHLVAEVRVVESHAPARQALKG